MNVTLFRRLFIGTSHHIDGFVYDLTQPLSFPLFPPSFCVFYSNVICKTHLHNVWGGCRIPILYLFGKLYSGIRKFCTSTQEKIHRNLKNPRQHFETSKERDTMHLNIFYNSPMPFFFPTGKEMSYLKGDWLLVTLQ